jgi:hypothetical protein
VAFIGVAGRDDTGPMASFVAEYDVGGFPHIADLSGEIWARYGVLGQPAFAFIDDDGSDDVYLGALGTDGLAGRIDMLLST